MSTRALPGGDVTATDPIRTHRHPRGLRPFLRRFRDDESGVLVVFSVFFFLMILFVGSIGVDLMRFEMTRTKLQHTNDRAVLAAADLDQTLEPGAVVRDYFAKAGLSGYLTSVNIDQGVNYRTVTARSNIAMPTQFMHMLGQPRLDAPALSTAQERVSKVEISMVLDISGSMARNSRISRMRDAAKVFVDTVIRPETAGLISVSLVPYSENVNAGRKIFDRLNTTRVHDYSNCVEFPDAEYATTSVGGLLPYEQVQQLQWAYGGSNDTTRTACPRHSYEEINPVSQNAGALKAQIDQLRPRAYTSIFIGMKWAAALLDPSLRPVVNGLVGDGDVDPAFAGRPAAYTDSDTLKTIVLMTDGRNTETRRLKAQHYDEEDEIKLWAENNMTWYLDNNVASESERRNYWYRKYDAVQGDALLETICTVSKARGIVVWSIGFEVDDHGAAVMERCASSPSHFFRVEGIEITEAFRAIARQINQLRLIQ